MPFPVKEADSIGWEVNREGGERTGYLLGLSRGNSYFSRRIMELLVRTSLEDGRKATFMLPDKPAVETLLAQGVYDDRTRAERRARQDFNIRENHLRKIAGGLPEEDQARLKILRWDAVEAHPHYSGNLEEIEALYREDQNFRRDVRAATRGVLQTALDRGELNAPGCSLAAPLTDIEAAIGAQVLEQRIDIGVSFFLQELALMTDAAHMTDVDRCAYVYHTPMDAVVRLLTGRYRWKPRGGNGYIIYDPVAFDTGE